MNVRKGPSPDHSGRGVASDKPRASLIYKIGHVFYIVLLVMFLAVAVKICAS